MSPLLISRINVPLGEQIGSDDDETNRMAVSDLSEWYCVGFYKRRFRFSVQEEEGINLVQRAF